MHAVLVTVEIDPARGDESVKLLHEFVIPSAKSLDGFERGYWLRTEDLRQGRGVIMFDTADHAKAAAARVRGWPPPGMLVTYRSIEVFEVIAEA
jgi:hypothetical protein